MSSIFNLARNGEAKELKKYLNQGFDVNAKNEYGLSLMYHAAAGGHREIQHLLLDYGFDVHTMENAVLPIFVYIVQKNNYDVLERMLKMGANPNISVQIGNPHTILEWTAISGNPVSTHILMKYGADTDIKIGNNSFFEHAYDCAIREKHHTKEWYRVLNRLAKEKETLSDKEKAIWESVKVKALLHAEG